MVGSSRTLFPSRSVTLNTAEIKGKPKKKTLLETAENLGVEFITPWRFGALTIHEPVSVAGEVCLADNEVEVGDDLNDGEERAVAVDAVHPDDGGVIGGLVVDHNPANNSTSIPQNMSPEQSKGRWNR
jgi:hypothetical protein